MGVVVNVNVRTGCNVLVGFVGGWLTVVVRMDLRGVGGRKVESTDLADVLRHSGTRNPSEWSVASVSI